MFDEFFDLNRTSSYRNVALRPGGREVSDDVMYLATEDQAADGEVSCHLKGITGFRIVTHSPDGFSVFVSSDGRAFTPYEELASTTEEGYRNMYGASARSRTVWTSKAPLPNGVDYLRLRLQGKAAVGRAQIPYQGEIP